METNFTVLRDVLDHNVDTEGLIDYLHFLDPEHRLIVDPANLEMLAPLLQHCGYRTLRELHHTVARGWENFRHYEVRQGGPVSGSVAILYTVLIADPNCREQVATREECEDLAGLLR